MAGLLFWSTVVVFVVVLKSALQCQTTFLAARSSIEYNMMLKWPDVLNLAKNGNPAPKRQIVKADAEWRQQLSPERIT
jgi:hypothetical protein